MVIAPVRRIQDRPPSPPWLAMPTGVQSRHRAHHLAKEGDTMAAETPTSVLLPRAWADATGFDAEIRALQRQGFRAIGFANPLRDLAADSAYLAEFLRSL